jgi:hypothetical protein
MKTSTRYSIKFWPGVPELEGGKQAGIWGLVRPPGARGEKGGGCANLGGANRRGSGAFCGRDFPNGDKH